MFKYNLCHGLNIPVLSSTFFESSKKVRRTFLKKKQKNKKPSVIWLNTVKIQVFFNIP